MTNLSDDNIDVASNNFSENKLINFDVDFNGLEKSVVLFFPSVRNAMVERYRAETFLKIGLKAQEIINILSLKTNPIPPKAALPLFEKMSLEHEEDMYNIWAKLLVSASVNYNPIQIQYAEILSKIGSEEAKLLIEMYKIQAQNISFKAYGAKMEKFTRELNHFNTARTIFKQIEIAITDIISHHISRSAKMANPIYLYIKHKFKKILCRAEKDFRGYANDVFEITRLFDKKENENSIRVLEGVNLIFNQEYFSPLLTNLGYKFITELEKYNIEDK